MRLVRVVIENFRSIEHLECDFGEVTSLIGPNGAGKSSVLRALDWFFNGDKSWLTDTDRHAASPGQPIRVRVDFDGLTTADREALGPKYAPDGVETLTVWRTWRDGDDKITGKAMAFAKFEEVRAASTAMEKRERYNELRGSDASLNLPSASSAAAVDAAMDAWEQENPDSLTPAEVSDTHFFGFNGRGKLSHLFDFVFVSADLRAHEETTDARDSTLGRILQRALDREHLDAGVQALVDEFGKGFEELSAKHLDSQLSIIGEDLSDELSKFTNGRRVHLSASVPVLKAPATRVDVAVDASGIHTPVQLQGHGLQRALLLSALTVLSRTSRDGESAARMFLAIEEPELFQHPTQARAFASVLRSLAQDHDQGVQVTYATHSPLFIDPRFFDEIRRVSSVKPQGSACAKTSVTSASVQDIESDVKDHVKTVSLTRRFEQVCLKYLPEALFAEACILVEGDEDAAILRGLGSGADDLAVQGIAVAAVSGKDNLLLPFAILKRLNIQALMVADNDSGMADRMTADGKTEEVIAAAVEANAAKNRSLCRFVGVSEEDLPVGAVSTSLAFVPDTMETLLASDLPGWDLTRKELIREGRGVDGKNAATYELAARECSDVPVGSLLALLTTVGSMAAA
jgi:energy-coupling factor transporter ATP-binding protein EcfA2